MSIRRLASRLLALQGLDAAGIRGIDYGPGFCLSTRAERVGSPPCVRVFALLSRRCLQNPLRNCGENPQKSLGSCSYNGSG